MKEYKEVAYNNMQEMLKDFDDCKIIKGLKAIEFLEENDLKVTFNLNATYDFIVISATSNATVKVQNGMEYSNCITLENEYQEIDTTYDNLIDLMQFKEHRKIKKAEKIINNIPCEEKTFQYNYCEVKEGKIKKSDILQLVNLGCKVEIQEDSSNNEPFRTIFKKDYVLEEGSIYCPTDMSIPSGKFKKISYKDIKNIVFDTLYIEI